MFSQKSNSRLSVRRSLFAVTAIVLFSGFAEAASAATLYIAGVKFPGDIWSDPGIVGGPIGAPILTESSGTTIIDMAPDVAAGKLYYSHRHPGSSSLVISVANLDGSGATPVITYSTPGYGVSPLPGTAAGLAIDTVGQKLYWADPDRSRLHSATTGGTYLGTIGGAIPGSHGLDIDVAKNLYYINSGTNILVGSLSGGAPSVLLSIPAGGDITGIDLDLVNNKIYWADINNSRIGVANLDGAGLLVPLTQNNAFYTSTGAVGDTGLIVDIEADAIGGHLYWSNWNFANSVGQSDLANLLNTGTATNVTPSYITGFDRPWGLAIAQDVAPAVPEPSTLILTALGLAGLGLVAWRKRK